jgi:hypothetical protein
MVAGAQSDRTLFLDRSILRGGEFAFTSGCTSANVAEMGMERTCRAYRVLTLDNTARCNGSICSNFEL